MTNPTETFTGSLIGSLGTTLSPGAARPFCLVWSTPPVQSSFIISQTFNGRHTQSVLGELTAYPEAATPPVVVTPPIVTPPTPPAPISGAGPAVMPGPTTTGPQGITPTPYAGPSTITTAGTIISGQAITSQLTIAASNVVISNCSFVMNDIGAQQPGGNEAGLWINAGVNGTVVSGCSHTGGGPQTVQILTNGTATVISACHFFDTPTTPIQAAGSTTVNACWMERIGWNALGLPSNSLKPTFNGTDHSDGIFFETGAFLTMTNNLYQCNGNPQVINGVTYQIANVLIFTIPYDAGDAVGPVTISHNWLDGGGTMFSLNGAGPFVITNNILGADEEYSPPWFAGNPGGQTKWGSNVTPAGVAIPVPTGFSNVVAA